MTLLRRISMFTLGALTAVAGTLAVTSPAQAEAPPSSCTNSSVCLYVNSGYRTDQGYELMPVESAGNCEATSFSDAISGVFNNSGRTIRLYKNGSCAGSEYLTFYSGTGHAQFSVRYPTYENRVNGVKFI